MNSEGSSADTCHTSEGETDRVTQLLELLGGLGISEARRKEILGDIVEAIYSQMRGIAKQMLLNNRQVTIQPTALANEAILRLIRAGYFEQSKKIPVNRSMLVALVRNAMCWALRDYIRSRNSRQPKEGTIVSLDNAAVEEMIGRFQEYDLSLIDLGPCLQRLAEASPTLHTVVDQRLFQGMSFKEIAEQTGITPTGARERFKKAVAWLKSCMKAPQEE